ncbi:MarR family winged helix-turn-helix transcriptional regulator [Actinoallomurus rhizosphaericola]|uniref:MarR family winged helix-turn-helix transcriptional regulator n=1 Tax=Actinoallomurus rhizosphaericola TaxID=2952536 RepID=UPI002093DC16|nr:MarR family transcriptional regulator [Actinoallomurus rhizosphaericola]MCO5998492.1 MarR family transcriptional regulator [Actinoallomurus rhizosphaericola]
MTGDQAPPMRLKGAPSWLIGQVSAHSHRLVTERFAAADARGYHYRLLAALAEFGPASQAELGRRTGVDRSDVVAALNELAEKKLIERSPDPTDRRRNIITVTPEGRDHLSRLDGVLAQIQQDLCAPLSHPEREELIRLLTRIVDHHVRARTAESPGTK